MKKHWLKRILFAGIGAGAGYAYYAFVGCRTGSCPIWSSPVISTAYGAAAGALLAWSTSSPSKTGDGR
jgi:hypothetical protein